MKRENDDEVVVTVDGMDANEEKKTQVHHSQ